MIEKTPFPVSPKGEKLRREIIILLSNSFFTPSPLGEVPIAIGRDGGQKQYGRQGWGS
jgi:hypothetical protein